MKKFFLPVIAAIFFTGAAGAEVIYLKSGKVINGTIVSETNESITVSVSGTRKTIKFADIDEIALKPRPEQETPKKTSASPAKTQFTSDLKQDMPDSKTYVDDNKSGVIVYNVQETTVEKPKKQEPAVQPAADDEFDAALYLLGGGESGSKTVKTNNKTAAPSSQPQETAQEGKRDKYVSPDSYNEDDYDPALFLLQGDAATHVRPAVPEEDIEKLVEEPKKEKKQKEPKPKKEKAPSEPKAEYDPSEKPSNETFLAIAFDMKGVNIFTGDKTDYGVKSSADQTENSDYGISLSAEQYGYLSRFAAVGVGIGFQFKRCLDESPGRFGFLPIYAAFKMRVLSEEMYHVYAVAHLGYNFLLANSDYLDNCEVEGGLYYAGGAGVSYNRYVFQILYSVHNASMSYSNSVAKDYIDKDVMYSKVGFYAGYLF